MLANVERLGLEALAAALDPDPEHFRRFMAKGKPGKKNKALERMSSEVFAEALRPAPYERALCNRIRALLQNQELLLSELGRPNVSPITKNLIEREIREVQTAIERNEQTLADQSVPEDGD